MKVAYSNALLLVVRAVIVEMIKNPKKKYVILSDATHFEINLAREELCFERKSQYVINQIEDILMQIVVCST